MVISPAVFCPTCLFAWSPAASYRFAAPCLPDIRTRFPDCNLCATSSLPPPLSLATSLICPTSTNSLCLPFCDAPLRISTRYPEFRFHYRNWVHGSTLVYGGWTIIERMAHGAYGGKLLVSGLDIRCRFLPARLLRRAHVCRGVNDHVGLATSRHADVWIYVRCPLLQSLLCAERGCPLPICEQATSKGRAFRSKFRRCVAHLLVCASQSVQAPDGTASAYNKYNRA